MSSYYPQSAPTLPGDLPPIPSTNSTLDDMVYTGGGALYFSGVGNIAIFDTTVTGNVASNGGGPLARLPHFDIHDSLLPSRPCTVNVYRSLLMRTLAIGIRRRSALSCVVSHQPLTVPGLLVHGMPYIYLSRVGTQHLSPHILSYTTLTYPIHVRTKSHATVF